MRKGSFAINVAGGTPPAKDFVDWPQGQAEKATRQWLDEHVGPLLAALPQERKHYSGQDFGRTGDPSIVWPASGRGQP